MTKYDKAIDSRTREYEKATENDTRHEEPRPPQENVPKPQDRRETEDERR